MNDRHIKKFKMRLREIRSLTGYTAGESVKHAAQRSKVKAREIEKLNSNENFFMPKEKLIELLSEVVAEIDPRVYPQEEELEVKKALGEYVGVSPECVILGNGSDPLLAFITTLFMKRGDTALSITPTFGIYELVADLQGAKYLGIPLKPDFSLDTEKILDSVTPETTLFFLCSPNNPTANQFRIGDVQRLIEGFPGLVVIDEAYAEFADYSIVRLIDKFENLVVIRTFSKAFGLAGLRFGYAVSNPDFTMTISRKAQLPFPVSSIILKMVLKLLDNIGMIEEAAKSLRRERERLIKGLNGISGIKAFDSKTNFVLFHTKKKNNEVFQSLLDQGLLIRELGDLLHLKGCLRTTIGLPETNDRLLAALDRIFGD